MSIEKIRIDSQNELEELLTKDLSMIEKDLNLICNHVPINDKTNLDVLCHDNNGQLVIVQINVTEDDVMLLHGIQSLDYIDNFKSFLKATYNKHKIDDKEKPRLVLIAPSFSNALRRAVESMKGIRIDLYEWEYLKLGDHKGLRLQPIFSWEPINHAREQTEERPREKKREPRQSRKKEPLPESTADETNETTSDLLKPEEPAISEDVMDFTAPVPEEPKEEAEFPKPEKEEPHKKKLRLF